MNTHPGELWVAERWSNGVMKSFTTIAEVMNYVDNLPATQRSVAQLELLIAAEDRAEKASVAASHFIDWVLQDQAWRNAPAAAGMDTLDKAFMHVIAAAREGYKSRDRIAACQRDAVKVWGESNARLPQLQHFFRSENASRALKRVITAYPDFATACRRLTSGLVHRLSNPGKGRSTELSYQTADANAAVDIPLAQQPGLEWIQRVVEEKGLRINSLGLVERRVTEIGTVSQFPHAGQSPTYAAPSTGQIAMQRALQKPLHGSVQSKTIGTGAGTNSETSAQRGSPGSPVTALVTMVANQSSPSVSSTDTNSPRSADAESCECDLTRADSTVMGHLWGQYSVGDERSQMLLLERFLEPLHNNGDTSVYCWTHTQAMAAHVGLQTQQLNHYTATMRLAEVFRNSDRLDTFKSRRDRYHWFRASNHPAVLADGLGPYRFLHQEADTWKIPITPATLDCIGSLLGLTDTDRGRWERDGNLTIAGLFDWWRTSGLYDLILEEFEVYLWHQRLVNGKANLSWLRTMLYGLGQQVMREDPLYWLLYVWLRPDHAHTLVAYPYYAKYQVPPGPKENAHTAFSCVDLPVQHMASVGYGREQIQGSLSLDNESLGDCTAVVPGMHRDEIFQDWARRLRNRGAPQGRVAQITSDLLTESDLRDYGTRWTEVPCRALEVRVTRPELPHSAPGRSSRSRIRRSMLPWFVKTKPDGTLEVEEGGTWEELSSAERDMTAPPRMPSGFLDGYDRIPYRFPASVKLFGTSPVSDALVARRRWDDPEVYHEALLWLDSTTGTVERNQQRVEQWRSRMIRSFKDQFSLFQHLEMSRFGMNSYYANQGDWSRWPPADRAAYGAEALGMKTD